MTNDRALQQTASSPARSRNAFLDVVRAIATVRVVAWHSFGLPVLSYLVAAMPAMFFVFGSLLASSARSRSTSAVLKDRLWRIMLPTWAFVLLTWAGAVVVLGRPVGPDGLVALASWLIPVVDPMEVPWEAGWLSSPLWFLRAMVWLLATAPLWLWLARQAPKAGLAGTISVVFLSDLAARHAGLVPNAVPGLWWIVGDLALYGSFALAGAALANAGALERQLSRRITLSLAFGAGVAGVAWRLTQPVHLGVVNNSHPLHLMVGVAWLALAFSFRDKVASLANAEVIGQCIRVINRRALTIYLWHSLAIIAAVSFLGALGMAGLWSEPLLRVVLIGVGVGIAVAAFGWVEDIAGRRQAVLWPTKLRYPSRFSPAHAGVAVMMMAAVLVPSQLSEPTSNQTANRPPLPSQQPPVPTFEMDTAGDVTPVAFDTSPLSPELLRAELRLAMSKWRTELGIDGVSASVIDRFGTQYSASSGTYPGRRTPVRSGDEIDLASATKMFTATLVFEMHDKGLVELDSQLPYLYALPNFPHRHITPRQLLTHQSGLVNYRDTLAYIKHSDSIDSPHAAIAASVAQELKFTPGEIVDYSSTNYLVLGVLLEQITGMSYEELFFDRFSDLLELENTTMVAPGPGEPRHSTAGLRMDVVDLARSGHRLLSAHPTLSDAAFAQMTDIDYQSSFGAGVIGFCPCSQDNAGNKSFFSVGHYGSDSVVAYVPDLDVTVALRLTEGMHGDERYMPVLDLMEQLARITNRVTPVT